MNFNDIHIGDIIVAKDGTVYKILDAYYTYAKENQIRLDLQVNDDYTEENMTSYHFEYGWIGDIDDLSKSFTKIGKYRLDTDKEKVMKQYEKVARKIDNAFCELNACGRELRELRKMTLELLDKE
jgi:signal peptidase I